jgi:hypothetical protein
VKTRRRHLADSALLFRSSAGHEVPVLVLGEIKPGYGLPRIIGRLFLTDVAIGGMEHEQAEHIPCLRR